MRRLKNGGEETPKGDNLQDDAIVDADGDAGERERAKMRADRRTQTEARNDDRPGKTAVSGIQSSDDYLFCLCFSLGGRGGVKMGMEGGKF